MSKLKLKICGMKHNVAQVAALQPDYLGFIFYEKSKRNFENDKISETNGIKRVGVFVDASIKEILNKIEKYNLDIIQLHGEETADYCSELKKSTKSQIWNVFSVGEHFDFDVLKRYESAVDAFLFDTKGKKRGGNGKCFNWEILKKYPSDKPFILSGGIGIKEILAIRGLLQTNLPIMAIDVNSKFENEPGLKKIDKLKKLQKELDSINS